VTTEQVGKSFEKHLTRAGLPGIRLHDLRHSTASHLLARGVPIASVTGRLDHSVSTCERSTGTSSRARTPRPPR
jgi:site-specific recombinase XerD